MRKVNNIILFALMQYQAHAEDTRVYTKTSVNPDAEQLAVIEARDIKTTIDCYVDEDKSTGVKGYYDNTKCLIVGKGKGKKKKPDVQN